VTSAVEQAADGSCTGPPIDLTVSGGPFTVAINDFMAMGGDGYPNLVSILNTPEIRTMDEGLADYIEANTPISPSIQGRITCVKVFNPASPNNCPVVTP